MKCYLYLIVQLDNRNMHIVFSVLTAQKDMHDKVRSCMVIDFRTDLYTLRNSQIKFHSSWTSYCSLDEHGICYEEEPGIWLINCS